MADPVMPHPNGDLNEIPDRKWTLRGMAAGKVGG
jgi:hypothetical protein